MLPGDVIVTSEAPLGEVAFIDRRLEWCLGQRLFGLRPVQSVDGRYLFFALRSPDVQADIQSRATGTTAQGIRQPELLRVTVPVPPIAEQKAIAGVLGALEDKIELNRRMNETLEAMARALFKSWFVDFDPVRAKMAGRAPFGMDAATAALFPRQFDGAVPAAWREVPLDSIADFMNGLALQKFPAGPGSPSLPVLKIAQLRAGSVEGADRASLDVPTSHHVHDGDLIFSWSGSLLVRVWSGGRAALNQHLFKVTPKQCPMWFVHGWLRHHLPAFQAIAADKATTMGHIQRHHLTEAVVVVPSKAVLEAAGGVMESLEARILANSLESRTLAELRDLLLPKLLSGELRIRDAEKAVEAAL